MHQTLKRRKREREEGGDPNSVGQLSAHSVEFDPLQLIGLQIIDPVKADLYQVVLSFVYANKLLSPIADLRISTSKSF